MADSQLTDYIRQRMAQGAKRNEISVELIRVGWSPAQINEALRELQVPMDRVPEPASVPMSPAITPAALSTHATVPALVTPQAQAVPPVVPAQGSESAMPGQPPAQSGPQGSIPRLFPLIGEAFTMYRENIIAVLAIGVVGLLFVIVMQVALVSLPIMSIASAMSGSVGAIITLVLGAILFMLVAWWISAVIMASLAHALRGSSTKQAFRQGLRQSLSYMWLSLLMMGLYIGYVLAFVFLPAVIGYALLTFVLAAGSVGAIIAGVYGVIAMFIVLVLIAARYSTALWVMIEGEQRGLSALLLSAKRVKPQLGVVGGRMLLGAILYAIVYIVTSFVFGFLFGFPAGVIWGTSVIGGITQSIQAIVDGGLSYLFFLPIMFAFLRAIHVRVRPVMAADTLHISSGERWGTLGLAWLGLLLGFALPIGSAALLASLHGATNRGHDAAIESNLMTIQTEAEIYNYIHKNSYGTAQDCTGGMFGADPTLQRILASLKQMNGGATICRADGVSYLAYSPLSSGKGWCVDSSGYSSTTAQASLSGTQCVFNEATSSASTTPQGSTYPASMQAAGFQSATATSGVYTDTSNGYSLTFPSVWGWVETTAADGTKGIMAHPGTSVKIQVMTDVKPTNGMTLARLKDKEVASIQSTSNTPPKVENRTVAGYPAVYIESYMVDSGGQAWQTIQLIVLKNNKFYLLGGGAPAGEWSTYKPIITNILESVSFSS